MDNTVQIEKLLEERQEIVKELTGWTTKVPSGIHHSELEDRVKEIDKEIDRLEK